MKPSVLNYAASFKAGPEQVGGKGWNLARLDRYGFPVPVGGVLIADCYRSLLTAEPFRERLEFFARCTADDLGNLDVIAMLARFADDLRALSLPASVRDEIQRFLADSNLTHKPLAVRSSATSEDGVESSFAGIHTSTLNVTGLAAIELSILHCYASLWTPQALAYRRRMKFLDRDTACAVVLCEMVGGLQGPPVAAGVAFSCDPRTGRRDVITVNSAAGLGDAVVSGRVTPDEYVLCAHDTNRIEARRESGGPLLEDSQIAKLGHLVWRVHWALGEGQDPQDIEWAFDGRRFWLLQARPVTHLPRQSFPSLTGQPPIWSNANVKDSFPAPATMMTWSMMEAVVRDVLFASLRLVRYPFPAGMEVMRRFAGRFYFDLAILQWSMYDAIGITPAETNRTTGGFQPEIEVPPGNPLGGWTGLARSGRRMRLLWKLAEFRRGLPGAIDTIFRENRQARAMNLASLTDAQLLGEFQRRVRVGNRFTPAIQLAAAYYGAWMTVLQDLLGRLTGDRQQSLVTRLLAASGSVASAEHGYRLVDLAELARRRPQVRAAFSSDNPSLWHQADADPEFRQAFAQYLDDFGHRGVCEMDFGSPRWREDPTYLLQQIRGLLTMDPEFNPRQRAAAVRKQAEDELHQLPWWIRPTVRWLLSKSRRGAALRESAKSAAAASVELMRLVLLEAGQRLAAQQRLRTAADVFYLASTEVEAYLNGDWSGAGAAELVDDRKSVLTLWQSETPPDVLVAKPTPARLGGASSPGVRHSRSAAFHWQGVAAAPGRAEGTACVIDAPHHGDRLATGDVLVAPSTDPGWTPLFLRASAVVMETGGYLSHGAIVAREFGIPSVVNIPGIMSAIASGDRLHVDGDRGEVSRVLHPHDGA